MPIKKVILLLLLCRTFCAAEPSPSSGSATFAKADESAQIAGYSLSKIQRWLHKVALPRIDPKTKLYISHTSGSARYREALWNYDDAAADTYPFLFWAAWYTDFEKINGPVLEVLEAEQRLCNHLDRIPTALNPDSLEKVIKSKDKLIFAASEYLKDGLLAIVEVAGTDNPWFQRMREITDDIWKHADIDTPYGKIPTLNLEANGEQIQILARLYSITGEAKYLEWAERLADYYLLEGEFVPQKLRDHGCEIVGGLGLLLAVESVHNPAKAKEYKPLMREMFDAILERGTNEDGMMYDQLDKEGRLSDGWGYNYVSYLIYDMVSDEPLYRERIRQTLSNLAKPKYQNYNWERGSVDGYADAVEGGLYLVNRLPVPEAINWIDREVADNIVYAEDEDRLWSTYKLDSNGVRTALMHALMHTRGLIARPWQQKMELGASETERGLAVVLSVGEKWSGKLVFDIPRHRIEMGFTRDWPRMNTMPEWFTVEPGRSYLVSDADSGWQKRYSGTELHDGLPLELEAGSRKRLLIEAQSATDP